MGGGDLNLKKSWHPHTMRNQEKLWKAEKAKSQEDEKLRILKNEKQQEIDKEHMKHLGRESGVLSTDSGCDGKLEWMYKNSKDLINREEYLMGRAVDKSFEILQQEEQSQKLQNSIIGTKQPINHVEHECVPFSIRSYKSVETTEQVDLQRKVMEDPLMLIKQRELESRRKILENPVKLKQLREILKKGGRMKKVHKKLHKTKKHKRSQKKRRSKSSSPPSSSATSDNDADLNRKLSKKLKNTLLCADHKVHGEINLSKLLDAKLEAMSREFNKSKLKKSKKNKGHHKSKRKMDCKKANGKASNLDKSCTLSISENNHNKSDLRKSNESQATKSKRERSKQRISSRSRSKERICSVLFQGKRKYQSPSRQERKFQKMGSSPHRPNSKMREDERERKLKEMMSNAIWREEERAQKVRKHREAYAKEEESHKSTTFDKNFYNKEMKKALDNCTTVSDRLNSNLNNIQRDAAAMNRNFVKK